ncbi:MAG TPA: hypothetical protein VIV58_00820, partial [Kofleriaceae bacterium]
PQVLPVVAKPNREGARYLVGTLVAIDSPVADEEWPYEVRHANDTLPIYLTERAIGGSQIAAVLCIIGEALLLAIIGFWISRRSRR